MMGGEAPETCWATHKSLVMNLWNRCILLVDLFESYKICFYLEVRITELQSSRNSSIPPKKRCSDWTKTNVSRKFVCLHLTPFSVLALPTQNLCYLISGFCCSVNKIFPLPGFCIQCKLLDAHRRFGTTYQSRLKRSSTPWTAWSSKMGTRVCSETSIKYYQSSLRKMA